MKTLASLLSLVSLLSLAAFAGDAQEFDFASATNGWTVLCRAKAGEAEGGVIFAFGRIHKRSVHTRWAWGLVSEGAGRVSLVNWWPRGIRHRRLAFADVPDATSALHLYAIVSQPGDGGKVALYVDGKLAGEADGFKYSPDCTDHAIKALPWGGESAGLCGADDAEVAMLRFVPRALKGRTGGSGVSPLGRENGGTPLPPVSHDALRLAAPMKADLITWPNPANGREDLRFAVTVTNGADVAVKCLVIGARDDSRLAVRHVAGRIAAEELVFGRGTVGYVLGGGKTRATLAAGSVRGDGFASGAKRLVVRRNGRLELGAGGWITENDSFAPGERRLVLAGGTLAAAKPTRIKTVLPVEIKGAATIEATGRVVCDCEFEGEGVLTIKGAGGVVIRKPTFAPVTLRVLKGSRVILAAPWHGDVVCEPGGKVVRRVD